MTKFTEQMLLDERKNIEQAFAKLSHEELLKVAVDTKVAAFRRFRQLEAIRDVIESDTY